MALIYCPDCKNQISDSAVNCIHCGRPMRLSREAILAEIHNLENDSDNAMEWLDDFNSREGYSSDQDSLNNIFNRLEKNSKRIKELNGMLR